MLENVDLNRFLNSGIFEGLEELSLYSIKIYFESKKQYE
jgi:hypothetical protein